FALILTARVTHVEAVEEAHLFRSDTASLKKAPARPGGELSERQLCRGGGGGRRVESEGTGQIRPAPLYPCRKGCRGKGGEVRAWDSEHTEWNTCLATYTTHQQYITWG